MTPWLGLACGPKLEALLDFATQSQITDGFGYLLADRSVDPSRGVETWINARMTHVFSLGCLAGRPTHLRAEHGIKALQQTLLDHTHGGWFSNNTCKPVKAAYDHAFVLLAASTAATAGIDGADQLLHAALAIWRERFWDPRARMAVEEWDASWSHLDDYRGANSNMHGVEAMLAASDALRLTGGPSLADSDVAVDLIHDAAAVIGRIVHGEARSRSWRLPEHYTNTWSADVAFNEQHQADPFRPFGVTVGHQFEWARLALHCAHALDDQAPSWLLADAQHLYEAAKTRGWGADGEPGFSYTLDWNDRPVVTARMHWVLAEAIAAAAVMFRVTGIDSYRNDLTNWLAHADQYHYDPATGSWHHELDPAGHVMAKTWSGQPDAYHIMQAYLLADLPVASSVAGALTSWRASTQSPVRG